MKNLSIAALLLLFLTNCSPIVEQFTCYEYEQSPNDYMRLDLESKQFTLKVRGGLMNNTVSGVWKKVGKQLTLHPYPPRIEKIGDAENYDSLMVVFLDSKTRDTIFFAGIENEVIDKMLEGGRYFGPYYDRLKFKMIGYPESYLHFPKPGKYQVYLDEMILGRTEIVFEVKGKTLRLGESTSLKRCPF